MDITYKQKKKANPTHDISLLKIQEKMIAYLFEDARDNEREIYFLKPATKTTTNTPFFYTFLCITFYPERIRNWEKGTLGGGQKRYITHKN